MTSNMFRGICIRQLAVTEPMFKSYCIQTTKGKKFDKAIRSKLVSTTHGSTHGMSHLRANQTYTQNSIDAAND